MIERLKGWYSDEYQHIVYAIQVAKSEYEKIGSFISPTLILLAVLKLFLDIKWWVVPGLVLFSTITAFWVGKFLIKMGVPKKSAQIGNQQNPELMEILNRIKGIEDEIKK